MISVFHRIIRIHLILPLKLITLPKSDNVSLKIYNELGKEVSSLVDGFKNAGAYEITFNGNGLSSGIYFYKIQTSEFTATRKMLLIK
ncbi:MAG: T9SS type A sorting domain-containing protein [Ignavibacteria bacterium]|nr:T9SS type A sorting domain-containing protein [Ignavibacteria bacterium]